MPVIANLFASLPLGFAVLDGERRITRCNEAFLANFGPDASESGFMGHPADDLLLEGDRPALVAAIDRILTGDTSVHELRVRLVHRPEETVTVSLAGQARPGGQAGILWAMRDYRDRLRLERQVAQVTKMQAISQLAGGVAHDFNNILTAVLGLCDQLLERRTPDSPDFADIDQIRQNAGRAAALVRQLLAFARQQTLRPQLLDVASIVQALSFLLQRLIGPKIDLITEFGENVRHVRADPSQLEQVIVNLAVNARDAMPDGGTLRIALRNVLAAQVAQLGHDIMPHADFVEMSVSDTGVGIAPEIAARIFEPFFTTKDVGKGTGLGLSTVYGIVKQTGGFIFAAGNAEGSGTSFTVYLPAAGIGERATAEAGPAPAGAPPGRQVLVVEDERAVRMVVERALVSQGLTVHTAPDADAAFELLETLGQGVDLLVSDVVMPGTDGITLVQVARARFPQLRVVLMSGYAEPPLRREVSRQGMVFLSKPFSAGELVAAVRSALADPA